MVTKLDIQMFHTEPWKPIFAAKGQRLRSEIRRKKQCQRGSLHCCELVSAGFS